MKTALLLLGHGSRDPEGQTAFSSFAALVRRRAADRFHPIQEAFLELAEPPIQEGVDRSVKGGPDRVAAVPIFLTEGGHVKKDIPDEIEQAQRRHPKIPIRLGRPLGSGPRVLEVLHERARETLAGWEDGAVRLIVVGRGSLEPEANRTVREVAEATAEHLGLADPQIAFADVLPPAVPETLERCIETGASRILILPHLLFPGRVLTKIRREAERTAADHPAVVFRMADCLGVDSRLADLVLEHAASCF